jgi:hypothetical protein
MKTFAQDRWAICQQLGIPQSEFMARMPEILAERGRIDDLATDRYNNEYRSAVIESYGHARLMGFTDGEMERSWQSCLGIAAWRMPGHLRAVAALIPDEGPSS